MDLKYDQKFEEMKKYIPFLESMITRLESTSPSSANPRQAQLDKIRSLRDLLLNKKKRMKMENLLKCEQVLVNLYAKVEQRDTLSTVKKAPDPGFSIDPPTAQEKSDLEAVRNKLKTVAKRQEEVQDTLPEILRGNEVEEVRTAGSKEPALFQRRPNKASISPTRCTPCKTKDDIVSPPSSASKRNYTRVLVSPDSSTRRWSQTESAEDKPLFSRRSPRRSPRRYSPSYHKRERKKSFKESTSRKSKDLNITLNVPEDSLSTLNTKDIFTRIINCSDGDVDIDTLRELRKQILTELQKTGARDDISDLILKSYKRKKDKKKPKRKEEVEEGELSDSESEVIENIYGNLCGNLVLKDQNETKTSSDKDQARKIQICLVINSDREKNYSNTNKNEELSDVSELEMFDKEDNKTKSTKKENQSEEFTAEDDKESNETNVKKDTKEEVNSTKTKSIKNDSTNLEPQPTPEKEKEATLPKDSAQFKANFYKPMTDDSKSTESNKLEEIKKVAESQSQIGTAKDGESTALSSPQTSVEKVSPSSKTKHNTEAEFEKIEKPTEIPLLNEPTIAQKPTDSTVSEIDILQALKNEILSESITMSGSETSTPLLHQPKIVKVASAKEILPKKRISIEKYKQKASEVKVSSTKQYLNEHDSLKDDLTKKPSLKLTEKECERFQIPKISFDDESSEDDDGSEILASDLYSDLAPKSPDDESSNTEPTPTPPVIIPADPVKTVPVNQKVDIDMRTLPILAPNKNKPPKFYVCTPAGKEEPVDVPKTDVKAEQSQSQNRPILDPRIRRESNVKPSNSPNPHNVNTDRMPRPVFSNVSQSPSSNAVLTPNARLYEITPNHQTFDVDTSNNKHVYVPTFTLFDSRDRENSVAKDTREKIESVVQRKSRIEDIGDASWSSSDVSQSTRYSDTVPRKSRFSVDNREIHKGLECPKTPVPSFGRSDVPDTSAPTFGRLDKPMPPMHQFGRADCPSTPSHPFGRLECPPTPSHSFGRSECPPTPSNSFGRSECPLTPSHPFGRSDAPLNPNLFGSNSYNINECPLTPSHTFGATDCPPTSTPFFGRNDCPPTPNHAFGRSDCPSTPSHPFGLLDCPTTPNHPFGRSDATTNMFGRSDFNTQKFTKDPRLNRKTDYESNSQFDERDRGNYNDRGYYRGSSYKSQKPFGRSDSYQNQDREPNRNTKYGRYYAQDQSGRQLRDISRREQSMSGSISKDYENDRLFTRERGRYDTNARGHEDIGMRRGNQPDRSVGRNLPDDQRGRSIGRSVRSENNFTRSSSRASSVGGSSSKDDNTLAVKPHAGRSFTIDTSVNSTFQSFLESGKGIQVFEYNFDARRKRASSVGRSLARESSVGRDLSDDTKRHTRNENKRNLFRRASSMGRDLAGTTENRSFQEIKADFESYRHPEKEFTKFDAGKIRNIDTKSKSKQEISSRYKKELTEKHKDEKRMQNTSKPVYSPRKNYRDPRMRRDNDPRDKYNDRYGGDARSRKSGIVYSNDNIVKGAILTSGYGVKNYKIPKIKRVVEEKEEEPLKKDESANKTDEKDKDTRIDIEKRKEETKEKTNYKFKDKIKETTKLKCKEVPKEKLKEKEILKGNNKDIKKRKDSQSDTDTETEKQIKQIDDTSKSDEPNERRLTRSSRKFLTELKTSPDIPTKTRKPRKSIISDSDSDAEKNSIQKERQEEETNLGVTTPTASPVKDKKVTKKPSAIDIDTSFGLEELEMFSDNVVSDPVLDNINALIADLDNDIDTGKNESNNDFMKEITLENMMQNITSPQEDNSSQNEEEFSKVLNTVDNLSKISDSEMDDVPLSNLNKEKKIGNVGFGDVETSQESKISNQSTTTSNASQNFEGLFDALKDKIEHKEEDESTNNTCPLNKPTNEDIVSTTGTEKNMIPAFDDNEMPVEGKEKPVEGKEKPVEGKEKIDEQNVDYCSTPDSTINTDEVSEKPQMDEGSADSTNEEVHGETNVTSTESVEPKPSSSRTETAPALELGSLLSILQDKSKIKELLTMLGDQSGDNDKIKKKLEKLSEIVSDEDSEEKTELPKESKCETSELTDVKSAENENEKLDQTLELKEEKELPVKVDDSNTQLSKEDAQVKDASTEDFIDEETPERDEVDLQEIKSKKKIPPKKSKFAKKGKGRYAKKVTSIAEKRVTRATAAVKTKQKKKPTRELQKLHEDIKEMFIRDDILSASSIRMCRLAKMAQEKSPAKEELTLPDAEPVVILEKFKNSTDKSRDLSIPEKVRKKPGPKPKTKISTDSLPEIDKPLKYKPGPKSKTKNKRESDPYEFETESFEDANTEKASEDDSDDSSDSEPGSLASSKSFGSSDLLAEVKKRGKRKRRGWQDGIIKPKTKKKKVEPKLESTPESLDSKFPAEKQISIPDMNCFTDKNYCFRKNELYYSCRLCLFSGKDIVHHYKNEHPHVEIPLSRMAPAVAKEAIDQCKEINFQAVSKISSEKYICLFCYREFANNQSILESFFWHVVSMHTGEYKHNCSECSNENRCPFSLDIPPPPKDTKGQLIGYICKKCNFTQLSLENLKTHVIVRHNDEQTAVYTINLAAMSKKTLKEFLRRCVVPEAPVAQASSCLQEITAKNSREEPSDMAEIHEAEVTERKPPRQISPLQSKITFETDDNVSELSDMPSEGPRESKIKVEPVDSENTDEILRDGPQSSDISEIDRPADQSTQPPCLDERSSPTTGLGDVASQASNDIMDYPHFKINITNSGTKEYICCINGKDSSFYHFKTTLLISMKKHVQLKHSENWDGYCFVCKVIVTPQGAHHFKDCFQHYLDKHMDNFPIFQKEITPECTPEKVPDTQITPVENPTPSKPYINVRPMYELISTEADVTPKESPSFPIIQSVVSLGAQSVDTPHQSPSYPPVRLDMPPSEPSFKYEEVQAKVMSNKHCVVLETMMARDKLVRVYKCAGRFCSFTSDSAEDALVHANTHQRIGGIDALTCSYCDFDAMGNAIDLVMHVFKAHGHCQYSCTQCFYRAASSQSVATHMARVHGTAQSNITVLRTTTVKSSTSIFEAKMLSRAEAVPFYVCKHVESGHDPCSFRTYTPDKFCEHIHQKHSGATSHICYMCLTECPTTTDLVQHMKSHGLKLYQCTWCVFGANNEEELLGHVSAVHPGKQPQAYLRIITNKEGTKEMRVLPLAFMTKFKVPTEDVTPSATRENPTREAERSIDLEKLIGLTMIVEQQAEPNEPAPINNKSSEDLTVSNSNNQPIVTISPSSQCEAPLVAPVLQSVTITATRKSDIGKVPDNQVIPEQPVVNITLDPPKNVSQEVPVKAEPLETPKFDCNDIVVLDSDEEENKQSVIDLSDEEASTSTKINKENKKIPLDILSTCPKCRQVYKSMSGLKTHLYYCYPQKEQGCRCAHCPYLASSRDNILQHYMDDHCDRNIYQCGICRANLLTLTLVKRHVRYVHKEKDLVVSSTIENGVFCYSVNVAPTPKRELPKRKLSATNITQSSNVSETTAKRRFSPQEINQLPINPILDHLVYCEICEFSTKVRLNMVRHLQFHAEQQPVAQTAPVNPVPHLETNEKHFDKMLNLASSSIVNRPPEKTPEHRGPFVAVQMAPELAARYPKQISARQRNTCGAIGCTYTSVDEPTLKRHWEALHSGPTSFNFRCVHCPNNQITDTSKPITASRVVAHLKMHDDTLYACSKCNFYHFKRDFLEKHLTEVHPTGQMMIVRENASAAAASTPSTPPTAAPTMDLKPWQCGFCKFKSMLRPEVVEHSFKAHQSKMQFRCGYCPYRASAVENVNNHLAHSHANEPEDVIYYYYREGSLPDEADGTPRWMKQRQKMGSNMPEVKEEEPGSPDPPSALSSSNIDLNLVKKEVADEASTETELSIEELRAKFGEYCEPNGIKYKCPLCSIITEDTREAMQSHLFEELKYRKWGCGLCTYKAFHRAGLTEHMTTEHRRQYDHIELPTDCNIEKWVAGQLDYQSTIIDKHKDNLAKQKIVTERISKPAPPVATPPTIEAVEKYSIAQLEEAFGEFGAPKNLIYCCPKCGTLNKDEASMRDHLEMELNKIRWGCTNCSEKYQTYHEAQFHCKGHDGPSRPKEAIRDPSMRAAWVTNVIQAQKKILQRVPITPATSEPPTSEKNIPENDNSLLVVRYEERVPTPDQVTMRRKRSAPDSDDERLVIDEGLASKKALKSCSYCDFKCKYYNSWREHILKHFNLKPYGCFYCDYTSTYRQGIVTHTERNHPGEPQRLKTTPIPPGEPYVTTPKKRSLGSAEDDGSKLICLFCEKSLSESEVDSHLHENIKPDFAKKGDVVVKCCICLVLRLDVKSLQDHHSLAHPDVPINYALFKLHHNTRETHYCEHCDDAGFKFLRDLKSHHNAVHPLLKFKYMTMLYMPVDNNEESKKKVDLTSQPLQKRCARKSTTKLPGQSVAKKSTTKLPYSVPSTSEDGYSYYKTKPAPLEEYANVTTLMSFCNRMMPFTLKKLSEIINIEPNVIVMDIKYGNDSDMTLSSEK